jgi:hypothetical protein
VFNNLLDAAPEPPDSKPIKVEIPEQCKYIRLTDLPPNVVIEPGRIEIKGDGFVILQCLALLARSLENDFELFIKACNATPKTDEKVSKLLTSLRKRLNTDGSTIDNSTTAEPKTIEATGDPEEMATILTGLPPGWGI